MKYGVLSLIALAGCAAPECRFGDEDRREAFRDPARLHAYFVDQVLCGRYANAHQCLYREEELLPYAAFLALLTHDHVGELLHRLVGGFEQHGVSVAPDGLSARVQWCNREFGISREYRMIAQKVGTKRLWKFAFTQEQLQELRAAVVAWFEKQKSVADGKVFVYPPDWRYAPVGKGCGHVPGPVSRVSGPEAGAALGRGNK